MGLLLGLIITLAAVTAYSLYITKQITGLRELRANIWQIALLSEGLVVATMVVVAVVAHSVIGGLSWRTAFGVLVVVVFLALGVAMIRGRASPSADPLKGLSPGIYQPKTNRSGETLPLPTTPPRR